MPPDDPLLPVVRRNGLFFSPLADTLALTRQLGIGLHHGTEIFASVVVRLALGAWGLTLHGWPASSTSLTHLTAALMSPLFNCCSHVACLHYAVGLWVHLGPGFLP